MWLEREIVCISCPIGCRLKVTWSSEEDIRIEGNRCPRGEIFGKEEILAPKRVVTATCAGTWETGVRVPVKTDAPLPKELVDDLLNTLYARRLSLPVKPGDIIIPNIGGSGVNLVATVAVGI